MQAMKEQFLGKEVQIYPGDSKPKFGVVLDINEAGVTFHITKSKCQLFIEGNIHFIAFSAGLSFCLVSNDNG